MMEAEKSVPFSLPVTNNILEQISYYSAAKTNGGDLIGYATLGYWYLYLLICGT